MKRACLFVTIALFAVAVGSAGAAVWTEYANSPTGKDINAIKMLDVDNGWAVGYWGEILRYQNGQWSVYYTWATQYLQDVDFGSANFGMAVGYQGSAILWNGSSWVYADIPTTRHIWGVVVPPGQDDVAWAVGQRGTLYRWAGGTSGSWSKWDLGMTRALHDIFFTSATDGWLCGQDGRVFHFDESTWSAVNASTANDFYCIYALSPNNVWVGGTNGALYHYEGVSWAKTYTPTTATIREMSFLGPTSGWAVCDDGVLLRYNGVEWKVVNINPETTKNFSGMYMVNARNGWAVGQEGMIYSYRDNPSVEPSSIGRVKALFTN
ncbi:MAG: YCF48-related protein [Candidatus Zixiibacteriota bacterium]|jgi:photosystem II stability/assembly factor-like uncharacterized protein